MKIDNTVDHSRHNKHTKEFQLIKRGDLALSAVITMVVVGLCYQGINMLYVRNHTTSESRQYGYFR